MQTINNQIDIINNSIELLKTGPEILQANQIRKAKAIQVGEKILSDIDEVGMTEDMDVRANNYLANVSRASTEMKESRAGVTQIMDQLKRMYTEVENDLDVKKPGTVANKIQLHRNQFAKYQADERERIKREAERVAAKAKEAIDIKYQMENNLNAQFADYLKQRGDKLQAGFNAITLENYEEKKVSLTDLSFSCNFVHEGLYTSRFNYHNQDELIVFSDAVIMENLPGLEANFMAEMNSLKDDLVEKLPSKLAELKEQKRLADEAKEKQRLADEAAANAKSKAQKEAAAKAIEDAKLAKEAQEKAEADQREREAKETADREAKAEEDRKAAALASDIKKQGEETMVMFDQEAANAEVKAAAEVRQGYEIEVLHPVGYTQIFALWFEMEGKNLPTDKIGNTKLDQMKTWAEKQAHKTGTKIESKFLKYEESYKAVNRKAK